MKARVRAMIDANLAKPKKRGRLSGRTRYRVRTAKKSPELRAAEDKGIFERFQYKAVYEALTIAAIARCYFCEASETAEILKLKNIPHAGLSSRTISTLTDFRDKLRAAGWSVTLSGEGEVLGCPKCVEDRGLGEVESSQDTSTRSVEEF